MTTSLKIARAAKLRPLTELGAELGLTFDELEPYGRFAGKISLSVLERLKDRPDGKLVVVTAMTPTPAGEGKTTTSIGLAQGLRCLGVKATVSVRQASLGPTFGRKGGANGGGRSQILPIDAFNLHLTGDTHAVSAAHNMAAAFLDNALHFKKALGKDALDIDPATIGWPRVVDINDRALRRAVVGLGGKENGVPREAEWVITPASEVMAILGLCHGLADLRARLGRIVVARRYDGQVVTCEDLKVAGAMTALLKEAIKPNLMQTLEGGPAFVHTGAFGNIAQGTGSVLADRLALKLADVVLAEAGFGADLGAEKFFDIKCRQAGLRPQAAIMVATLRALKTHGVENLVKHIENVRGFGLPVVVAINAFPDDDPAEVRAVRDQAMAAGAAEVCPSRHYALGGPGAVDLARALIATLEQGEKSAGPGGPELALLYPDEASLSEKITTIATRIYGALGVDFEPRAQKQLAELEALGYGRLPICMAKTPLSLSHDPKRPGRPQGFRVPVREVRLLAGAGFVTVVTGEMQLMPGLPAAPQGAEIDLDPSGEVVGLR